MRVKFNLLVESQSSKLDQVLFGHQIEKPFFGLHSRAMFSFLLVISECNSVYCLNGGTCRDESSGYRCDCRFGFYGKRCEGNYYLNQSFPESRSFFRRFVVIYV